MIACILSSSASQASLLFNDPFLKNPEAKTMIALERFTFFSCHPRSTGSWLATHSSYTPVSFARQPSTAHMFGQKCSFELERGKYRVGQVEFAEFSEGSSLEMSG